MNYQRLLIGLLLCFPMLGNAQIQLSLKQMSFIEALTWLHEQHGLEFSFKAGSYSECIVDISARYQDLESALMAILAPCQLNYQKVGSVYLIGSSREIENCDFRGRLMDAESGEALSGVVIEHAQGKTVSDPNGYFVVHLGESQSQMQFSHIVYQSLDTALRANTFHTVNLQPKSLYLKEVLIEDSLLSQPESYGVPIIEALQNDQLSTGFFQNFEELASNEPSIPYHTYPDRSKSQEIDRIA
ncbi:MAG: hypothetical protein AAFN10_24975, partial [Bacteroidota bacterium]